MFLNSINKKVSSFNQSLFLLFTFLVFVFLGNLPLIYLVDYLNVDSIDVLSGLKAQLGIHYLFILLMFPFLLGFLFILIFKKWAIKETFTNLFTSRTKIDWKRVVFSFSIWFIFLIIFLVITTFSSCEIKWNFKLGPFVLNLILALIFIPIQIFFEELLFRSLMFKLLGRMFKKGVLTVILTGLFFGLMHGSNPEVAKIGYHLLWFYVLTGIFLGIIVLMDDGIELTSGYHLANNFFAVVILTNNWQVFQTDALLMDRSVPTFGWDNLVTILIIQPLLIYIFSKKYQWGNWKERLFKNNFKNIEE